ncbi:22K [Bovine mastadenovirus A]|uniref:22K n=1 Tax=Bovine mastadenovirus A TaxID=129953 RepID=UPI0000443F97|nr:22K [Bovine mastadenovirus A]
MPRAVRPTSLNLTKPKSRKKAAPEPPPPTPDEETLESIPGEDVEEEWDDIDSLVAEESEMEDEELEDGETSVSELLKKDQPPPLPPKTRKAPKQRRWDQTPTSAPGKQNSSVGGKYKSWRPHKHHIITALLASGYDVSFARRFMLYRHGINVPKNVIHYYNSQCRTESPEEVWKANNPVSQYIRRAGDDPRAES